MELTFDYTAVGEAAAARTEQQRLTHLASGFQMFVGHELANGLVSVQAYARLLLEEQASRLDEEGKTLLGRLANLVRRLDTQARQLAEIGRLVREPPWGAPVDLDEAVREAVAEVKVLSAGRPIPFEIASPLGTVQVSRRLLARLLVHLLSHAASAEGAKPIHIATTREPGGVTLSVRHGCPGLTAVQAARLGEAFVPNLHNSGLGFFLARQLVALWRGRLVVQSGPGQPGGVLVYLPDPVAPQPVRPPEAQNEEPVP